MSNMPTAEEELNAMFEETGFDIINKIQKSMVISSMKLFAELHVIAALKSRDELYETYYSDEINFTNDNKDFIKKSYPLENIK